MSQNLRCMDCLMFFDSQQALNRHKSKFCTNSKYASLDSLQQQFQKAQQGKDISLYGRQKIVEKGVTYNLNSQKPQFNFQKDRQYRELLRQIGDREDLRQKLNRQKLNAEQQLAVLEKKQKELVFQSKRQQLENVLKKREDLALQEEFLQQQIRNFQKQFKQQTLPIQSNSQDFGFMEGRQAGKLAMQRRMLEQKKREIENNIKLKKREEQKVNQQLNDISQQPIFIPDYRKKPVPKQTQRIRTQPKKVEESHKQNDFHQSSIKRSQAPPPRKKYSNNDILPEPKKYNLSITKQAMITQQQKLIQQPQPTQQELQFLKASRFAGPEKTLFQSLNPKGKSDQDIFIQSLVAQQYDALNLLARIPKQSELYQVKLKQFHQMSRLRQQLKQKVQKVRLQKVRRQFQLDKEMTQTEKANLKWLDRNRQNMLKKEVNILNNHHNQQAPLSNSQNSPAYQQSYNGVSPLASNTYNNSPIFQTLPSGNNLRPQSRTNGPKVYHILIKSLRNYSNKNPVCIRAILTEEANASPLATFTTKYHDESAPKDERNPYNPGVKNRYDESGDVIYNESFEIKEDLQSRYNSRQQELYLWLLVMQKDPLKISNQPQVYIWYCFKLTHFGQLREGTFTLSLFHDQLRYPQPLDMNKMRSKAVEQLVIQLTQDIQRAKPEILDKLGGDERVGTGGSVTSIRNKTKSNRRKKSMRAKTLKKINSVQSIKQQFFIANEQNSQFQQINSNQEIDLQFTVIAVRTMPSYTGPIKVQVLFIDCRNRFIFGSQEALAQYGPDMYNPQIDFTFSIKKETLPPSSVAVIKIMGLSTLNYTPGLLGFGYFHLCFDQEGIALQNDTKKQYFLIEGLYQIPVHWGNCNSYLKSQQIQNYATIPCFSLLISVSTSPNEGQFPDYQQGVYNTIFFQVTDKEYRLFTQQMKRQKLSTIEYVNAYFKYKGVNVQKYGQNDLSKLVSQSLAFNQQNISSLFVLHAMAEYSPTFGGVLGIDLLSIPTDQATNYYYFCTNCLYPPATFYNRGSTDLNFFYQIDLANSLTHQLSFMDEAVSYYPEYRLNTLIIIEVNRIKLATNGQPQSQVQTCAYTTLPFFDLEQKVACVNVGPHRIKLNVGQFQDSNMKLIENNFVRFIQLEGNKKKSEFQLQIRLMNGYFSSQFRRAGNVNKGKPLRSIFQNSKGFKQSQLKVKRIIEDTYAIKLQ